MYFKPSITLYIRTLYFNENLLIKAGSIVQTIFLSIDDTPPDSSTPKMMLTSRHPWTDVTCLYTKLIRSLKMPILEHESGFLNLNIERTCVTINGQKQESSIFAIYSTVFSWHNHNPTDSQEPRITTSTRLGRNFTLINTVWSSHDDDALRFIHRRLVQIYSIVLHRVHPLPVLLIDFTLQHKLKRDTMSFSWNCICVIRHRMTVTSPFMNHQQSFEHRDDGQGACASLKRDVLVSELTGSLWMVEKKKNE